MSVPLADAAVRRALREALAGGGAHVDLDAALADLPASARGLRPDGAPHAIWELVEHLRIAQEDLVAYTTSAEATSPPWPEGYWPAPRETVDDATWQASVEGLRAGLAAMRGWVDDPAFDLTAEIPWSDALPGGGRRTPLRQVLVACDHLGYHLGQIVAVRRALGLW
jgi:hypothetical protein